MTASLSFWALVFVFGGPWTSSNAAEETDYIFSSDPILLATSESSSNNTWLTCNNKQCSSSKRQPHENVYTHGRKVFHIYAKERSTKEDPIRDGDEVALFYKENDDGFGLWLSCEPDTKLCGLGRCPGFPHFKHWMWSTESCYENRFLIAIGDVSKDSVIEGRHPLRAGNKIHLIKMSKKMSAFKHPTQNTKMGKERSKICKERLHSDVGKWIIQKDMIDNCGHVSYDARHKVCDRCGSRQFVRPKHESWRCCAGEQPYNPTKSICCEDSLTDLSTAHRDTKEARCCGAVGYFPELQICCLGKVHFLPGQDTDADDSTVQCCGDKPYLTTRSVCENEIVAPLEKNVNDNEQCRGVKPSLGCSIKSKKTFKSEEWKCCDYAQIKEKQRQCRFKNNTYMSGERFSDPSSTSSCRTCVCQDGSTVCDTVSSCPAILPHGCSFYPANGECCPVFECLDNVRDDNHQVFLTRSSQVSLRTALPELEALTISFWVKTEQEGAGTLLSYATESQPNELVIRTHPSFRLTFKASISDDIQTNLNDGAWHFVCIQWKSLTGQWSLFVDNLSQSAATFSLGRGATLEENGYLVLGKTQQSQGNLIDVYAFVGSVAHLNIWDSQIDFVQQVKTDCLGRYEGNVSRWSLETIDTHHSASLMKADVCVGSTQQQEASDSREPKTQHFLWEVLGTELEKLSGKNCVQSSVYRVRSSEHSFRLNVCPSSTDGSLGDVYFSLVQDGSSSSLYWPFPYSVRLSVLGNGGREVIYHDLQSGDTRRKSKAWSLSRGTCTGSEVIEPNLSSIWENFITVTAARRNYNSDGNLRIKATVYMEKYGDWLYWNGHYYSHRNRSKEGSWYAAEAVCRTNGEGVHLVSIHSQDENNFVKSRASDEQWIGLTDQNVRPNAFAWADRSSYGEEDFKNWAPGETREATWSGNCAAMRPDGKWVDVQCDAKGGTSETARSLTCKTPGRSLNFQVPPTLGRKVLLKNQPGIFSVDLVSSGGQTSKVTFFTGLHYTAPNMKFTSKMLQAKHGAKLEFADYVDMTASQLEPLHDTITTTNDVSGVADLDGVVDKIKIPYYDAMNGVGGPAFSIEFWIRPRRMPLTGELMALFSKSSSSSGSVSLNLYSNGSLAIMVASTNRANSLSFITTDNCKVKPLTFQHLAVTGRVRLSLKVLVNGELCVITSKGGTWRDVTTLPFSSEGPLVFGESTLAGDSTAPKRFNGQIAYIRLFDQTRTQQQVQASMNAPSEDTNEAVGSWHLRQSKELNLIHYVVSDSNHESDLQVLEDFHPVLSSFPVVAIERNGNIFLFRVTAKNKIVAKTYALSTENRKLTAVVQSQKRLITGSKMPEKGCFTVALDRVRDHWIVITCKETKTIPSEVMFVWKVFNGTGGQMTPLPRRRGPTSVRVAGVRRLDTVPSAIVLNDHLLLSAGTTNNAETLFLDLTLDEHARPALSARRVVPLPVGPYVAQSGVTYYSYLYKPPGVAGSTSSEQRFLRRARPQNGQHSSSYTLHEDLVDPSTLTANAIHSDVMPENDWFWFLFRIRTMAGGNAIQSGQRIVIQTPDNNPRNDIKWSFVRCNGQNLVADEDSEMWNFFIFKTKTCDPQNGGFSLQRGEIGPNDCVVLWPRTLQFGPNCFCKKVLAFPSEQQIQGAREAFGSWFGPWRLMAPMHPTPKRPLPQPRRSMDPAGTVPRSVHEGNKYALLHYGEGEGIKVPSLSGVRAALLRFARTATAPVVVSNTGSTAPVKLLFRGNGGPLPLIGAFQNQDADKEEALNTVYREGGFAQKRMTSGLFYSVSYKPPSEGTSYGEFKNLSRLIGLDNLEYPKPPVNFVWLLPPPLKINGICGAVSKLLNFNTDTIQNSAPNSITSLRSIIAKAIGPGSFDESLFKPLLTVPIDVKLLHELGEQSFSAIMKKLHSHVPKPPGDDSQTAKDSSPEIDSKWQEFGEVTACLYLSNMSDWKTKVQKQRIQDKLEHFLNSEWMKEQMIAITSKLAPEILRNVSSNYSSYGGIAVFIANQLRSPAFLEQLLHEDLPSITLALQSHLPLLDSLRPDLGIAARKDITSMMLARTIVDKPWDVLRNSKNNQTQNMAIKMALDKLLSKSDDTKEVLLAVLKTVLGPMTSTQLAIIEGVLNIKKQRALEVDSERRQAFEEGYFDTFKTANSEEIAYLGQLPGLEEVSRSEGLEPGEWQKISNKVTDLRVRQFALLKKYRNELLKRTELLGLEPENLRPATDNSIKRWLTENPKAFAKVSGAFNTIGTIAALGTFISDVSDPDSALRNGSAPAVAAAVATLVGATGSFKGTADLVYNLGKILKKKLFSKFETGAEAEEIEMQPLSRNPGEAFEEYAAADFRVDLASTERVTGRLESYFTKASKVMSKVFVGLGVAADFTFLGIGIYNIVEDFKADRLDPWKITDDFALTLTAGAGAAIGIISMLGFETGPAGAIVFFVGLFFIIIDAFRSQKEAKRLLHEARCKKWTQWCHWGKDLFTKYHFLINENEDPCATCPLDKRHLLRALCLRGQITAAHRLALGEVLDTRKDIGSLVPSGGMWKQKLCPAWLRHFYKRGGSSHNSRKGKSKQPISKELEKGDL